MAQPSVPPSTSRGRRRGTSILCFHNIVGVYVCVYKRTQYTPRMGREPSEKWLGVDFMTSLSSYQAEKGKAFPGAGGTSQGFPTLNPPFRLPLQNSKGTISAKSLRGQA